MSIAARIVTLVAILGVAGCGASKHVQRDNYRLESRKKAPSSGLRAVLSPSSGFDGKLDLLYEKEIKGSADSPMQAVDELLILRTTRDRVLIIDQATGERKARIKKRRGIILDPMMIDSFLVIVRKSTYGEVEIINLYTGSTKKKRVIPEIRSGPATVMNRLIYGTTRGIIALSVPDLKTVWKSDAERLVAAPPVSDNNVVYYTSDDDRIRAVNPSDGSTIWESQFDASVVSDISAGAFVYFGLSDGRFVAVDKSTGEIVWETPLGYQVRGGAAESKSAVFVGCTDGSLYRLSRTDGSIEWSYETDGIITAPPLIYGHAVVIGSHDRHLYSIDAETGQLIDRRRLEGAISFGAVAAGKKLFITCRKERLYCFEG